MNKKDFFKRPNRHEIILLIIYTVLLSVIVIFNQPIRNEFDTQTISSWIKDYPEIRRLTLDLVRECQDEWCEFDKVEWFILSNITYKDDSWIENAFHLDNDPLDTLKYGNDCEGKAILALDMLKSIGKTDLYLIVQQNHVCWAHQNLGLSLDLYNCNSGDIWHVKRVA